MPDEILLNEAAYAVWQTVKDRGPIELGDVVKVTGIDQAQVSAAATEAAKSGYFSIEEREREKLTVSEGARELIEAGLPEERAARKLFDANENWMHMTVFTAWAKDEGIAANEVIKWGRIRGSLESQPVPGIK